MIALLQYALLSFVAMARSVKLQLYCIVKRMLISQNLLNERPTMCSAEVLKSAWDTVSLGGSQTVSRGFPVGDKAPPRGTENL